MENTNKKEIEKVMNFINSIPEKMCGGGQPQFLFDLSRSLKGKGEIVELGTCAGKSLVALAYAQKIKNNGRKIFSIDIKQNENLDKNLKNAGVENWVNLINGHSSSIAKKWNKKIELLWIDMDHSYIGIKFAIKRWSSFIINGGYIAFHDYSSTFSGVIKAVNKFMLSAPELWKVVSDRETGSIFVVQKIGVDNQIKMPLRQKLGQIKSNIIINVKSLLKEVLVHLYNK